MFSKENVVQSLRGDKQRKKEMWGEGKFQHVMIHKKGLSKQKIALPRLLWIDINE